MAKNQLTVCYLTKDHSALTDIIHALKPAFSKVIVLRAETVEEAHEAKGVDLIITDKPIEKTSSGRPQLHIVSEDEIPKYISAKDDFITAKELTTHVLARTVMSILEKKRLSDELNDSVIKDPATGLYNQRYLIDALGKEVKKAVRYGYPLTVIYIGLDGFKKINLQYGPELGDQAIVDFGLILSNSLRCVDTIGRFTGDEFMAILPETSAENSLKACERIKNAASNFASSSVESHITLSVGIGIASLSGEIRTSEELLKGARMALAGAKKRGRGSICTFEEAKEIDEPTKENRELISAIGQQLLLLTEEAKKNHLAGVTKLLSELPYYKKLLAHHERVSFYAERLAAKLSLKTDEIALVKNSALLHDIGKLAIDERIVLKAGLLSSTEYAIIKQHPLFASQMLSGSFFLKNEANAILHHHEHFDGNGYPDHMHGSQIPLPSRIITLAETWDAMITAQSYRSALPLDHALAELKKQAGKQFDPELVAVFTGLIEG